MKMRFSWLAALFVVLLAVIAPGDGALFGRSAHIPRHSGMEAPGGPRQLGDMPMAGPTRTPEGGMGYTDAYGRTLTDKIPEERKRRPRPAYGAYRRNEPTAELPDVDPARQKPVWSFR